MTKRTIELLGAGVLLCVSSLLGCEEGTLSRDEVTRPRDNPLPPIVLTSSDVNLPDATDDDELDEEAAAERGDVPECETARCDELHDFAPDGGDPAGDVWSE